MRTFEDLRGTTDSWCTSLAYWLGVYRGEMTPEATLEIADALSYQYDFEEQADVSGRVFPEDASWTAVFSPVAPIQLALEWSPVPRAIDLVGEPALETVTDGPDIRTIAVAWTLRDDVKVIARRLRGTRPTTPDERRFAELLTAAVIRAAERSAQLLLIAQPGWSYDSAHRMSSRTSSLMKKAGFVVTSRTPS